MNAELLRELARIARSSELHDLRVGLTPDETDALANMLEREHEEAERLRNSILNDMAAVLCDPDGNVCIRGSDGDRKVLQDAIDRARKGVSDE